MGIHFQEIFSAALWLAKFKAGEETLKIQDLIMEKLLLVLLPILICFAVYAYAGEEWMYKVVKKDDCSENDQTIERVKEADSFDKCKEKCDANKDCKYFSRYAPGKLCVLKKSHIDCTLYEKLPRPVAKPVATQPPLEQLEGQANCGVYYPTYLEGAGSPVSYLSGKMGRSKKECDELCKSRSYCKGVEYRPGGFPCFLVSKMPTALVYTKNPGKFSWFKCEQGGPIRVPLKGTIPTVYGSANCGASKSRYFLEGTKLAGLPAEGDSKGTECKNACMASAQCKGYHVTIKAVSRSISKSSCTYYSKVTAWKRMSNLRARAFSYEKC